MKRAANAERDIASSWASEATVHFRAGSRWMFEIARPIWGSRSAPSQPVCAAGSLSIQARIAWITRMSPRRVITASPPGRSSQASDAISRSMLCIHSGLGELDAAMRIVAGRISIRLPRGRVREAQRPADQAGGRATLAVAKDLVALADELTLEVEDPRRGSARFAAQDVTLPVRHEREVSELEPSRLLVLGLEPDPA